jgi:hypothetical protein
MRYDIAPEGRVSGGDLKLSRDLLVGGEEGRHEKISCSTS